MHTQIVDELDNFLKSNNNSFMKSSIDIVFDTFYLNSKIDNIIDNKIKIKVDILDLSNLYFNIYKELKTRYLTSNDARIKIQEITSLEDNSSFLRIIIKNNKKEINLDLKVLLYEKEILDIIKEDWINTINKTTIKRK